MCITSRTIYFATQSEFASTKSRQHCVHSEFEDVRDLSLCGDWEYSLSSDFALFPEVRISMWYCVLLASRVYPGSWHSDQDPAPQGGRTCSLHPPSARSYTRSAPSSPRPPSPPSSPSPPAGASRFRHRYVTELIQSAGAVHRGHHSRYHRFFSNAAWSIDDLYEALAREAVATFYPEGTIELGVDDTLCRKRGLDDLRHRDAPRPADLQPPAAPRQLGTRLGDPLAAHRRTRPGRRRRSGPCRWACGCTATARG